MRGGREEGNDKAGRVQRSHFRGFRRRKCLQESSSFKGQGRLSCRMSKSAGSGGKADVYALCVDTEHA